MKTILFVPLIISALAFSTSLQAQSLAEVAAAEAARRGEAAAAKKVYTNKDLPAPAPVLNAPAPALPTSAELANPARREAIASLRAVQSVIAGGANVTEFKKYYLDAKVKTDALESTPANAPIKDVSAIYADAVTLSMAAVVQSLSADEARSMRQKYDAEPNFPFESVFSTVPSGGFTRESVMTTNDLQRAAIGARYGGQMLLGLAAKKLSALK